jgi:diaminohydroxyphosphoribosylaminopyrimidine deaminase/5-amino-6-(5-phosphoribosylamino)uracil reductase
VLTGLAHVTLKAGMSLDGRTATRAGHSQWITGEAARTDAHSLRAAADLVLVGSGTARADDPELTARRVPTERQPVRAVIDGTLRTPPGARMVRSAREVPTWVFTRDADAPEARALRDHGVRVLSAPGADGRVDLRECLRRIAEEGLVEVLCEGGGALHGALLTRGLAGRVVCYLAPTLLGAGGAAVFGHTGPERLEDAPRLQNLRVSRLGEDLKLEAELG